MNQDQPAGQIRVKQHAHLAEHPVSRPPSPSGASAARVSIRKLNFFYGPVQALHDIDLDVLAHRVTAIIGPSGCGKSTLLRTLNRIFELYRHHRVSGEILLDGDNILSPSVDVLELRRRIGMIFQKPSPLPLSIFENIAYPLRLHYSLGRAEIADRVEDALKKAALWEEVKERLHRPGTAISGGQQQRLCIARAIVAEPEVLLMDEPCSSLDPISTHKVEELIEQLKVRYTIVIVTHNMQQAARISDYTAVMYLGRLVEYGATEQIFNQPRTKESEDYIRGRVG